MLDNSLSAGQQKDDKNGSHDQNNQSDDKFVTSHYPPFKF
jgi:hypothetical protein